jgi:hypothetical protein
LQIVKKTVADGIGNRNIDGLSTFERLEVDMARSPVDVFQSHKADLPSTDAIRVENLKDGVVTLPKGCFPINAGQHLPGVLLGYARRKPVVLMPYKRWDRGSQIPVNVSALKTKSAESAHGHGNGGNSARFLVGPVVENEPLQDIRRELS